MSKQTRDNLLIMAAVLAVVALWTFLGAQFGADMIIGMVTPY
jgi:hypothetical protein|tara:strand:- start:575 stop:700 length:126 start_codon:yes stop_codon:yes gene_type:complete